MMSGLSRRAALKGALAAAALPAAPHVALAIDDDLMRMIRAYKDECRRMDETVGDIPDGYPTPHYDALAGEEPLPVPTSRASAVAALRLAVDTADGIAVEGIFYNLMCAALSYLEELPAA